MIVEQSNFEQFTPTPFIVCDKLDQINKLTLNIFFSKKGIESLFLLVNYCCFYDSKHYQNTMQSTKELTAFEINLPLRLRVAV